MDIMQAIVLALIQGVTEFLPISSSAHLIILPKLSNSIDQGLAFDIIVHLGSLTAVIHYFRRDLASISYGCIRLAQYKHPINADSRLALLIIIGTIPAGLVGLLVSDWIEHNLRSIKVIAWASIGFALLLALADRMRRQADFNQLTWIHASFIGCLQVLALIPGTSRSGITITAALLIGFSRQAAARFSMLLAVPLIIATSALLGFKLINQQQTIELSLALVGFGVSALSAWLSIHLLIRFVEQLGMLPFVVYRILLGSLLLLVF